MRQRASPSLREQTILLATLIGSAQMTWGVIVPVLPLIADEFSLTVALLGPVIAAFSVGRVIANVPAGLALRRINARPYVHSIMLALALVTALTGLVGDAAGLIAMRFIAGVLGGAAVTVGFAVLVAGAPATERGRVMATATVVQMSAAAAGSVLGGAVITIAPFPVVFVVAAVPVLCAVAWDLVRPAHGYWAASSMTGGTERVHRNDTTAAGAAEQQELSARDPAPLPELRETVKKLLLPSLVAFSFAVFFARFAGEQGLVPVMAYSTGGMGPLGLGLAMAVGTLASAAVLPFAGRRVDKGSRIGMLVWPTLGAVLALALMPFAGHPIAFGAAIAVYAVGTSMAGIVPGVITSEVFGARDTGFVVGLTRTAGDLGAAIGPLLVFAVADRHGNLWGVILIAVTLVITASWLASALSVHSRKSQVNGEPHMRAVRATERRVKP